MKLEIFALCDAANTDSAGRISLLGSFDHISAASVPISRPFCAVVIKIRFERIEEGMKSLRISFVDDDGNPVMPTIETQAPVQFTQNTPTATLQMILAIQQIRLPNFGEYSIDLAVGGTHLGSIPLYAQQSSAPPLALPPSEEGPH
ncbi:MAG TPA: hypothetical protein VFB27_06735 [Opitutaceae bacterium]|nr:hypothetical protein [Opitutaceae bacterium]